MAKFRGNHFKAESIDAVVVYNLEGDKENYDCEVLVYANGAVIEIGRGLERVDAQKLRDEFIAQLRLD